MKLLIVEDEREIRETIADFFKKPIDKGGFNLGTLFATTVSIALMIILILIENRRRILNTANHV